MNVVVKLTLFICLGKYAYLFEIYCSHPVAYLSFLNWGAKGGARKNPGGL